MQMQMLQLVNFFSWKKINICFKKCKNCRDGKNHDL